MIENRVPALLAEKFGGAERVNLLQVQRETSLAYTTITRWARDHVDRFDRPALDAWCKYFSCQVGDLLIYRPE